jgi:DNA/RNA-binding domain of Phe-tRNA-synthetase-like protein
MFAAEIDTHLLTAGHDLAKLEQPLIADVTRQDERYVGIGGKPIEVKAGDLSIRDSQGIVSTVLYGPDQRTRLVAETESVLFTTYAPTGVSDSTVEQHLRGIEKLVRCAFPMARTEVLECRGA